MVFIGGLAVGTAKSEKMSSALGYFVEITELLFTAEKTIFIKCKHEFACKISFCICKNDLRSKT